MKWENIKKSEKKILIISSIAVILTIIIGVSYAYIGYYTKQEGMNVLKSDCINVEMEELTNALNLKNAHPVTDEVGTHTKPFRFKLTNTCGVGVNYNINLEVMESEARIASQNIAVKVDTNEKSILSDNSIATPVYKESDYTGVESYTVGKGELKPYNSSIHEVRIWLDESAGNETQNGTFYSKVMIEAIQNQIVEYKETILNGADPVLSNNLIPVEISDTGVVTRADLNEAWYSYENKKWANAIILEDETVSYEIGEEIPEENIESYFVWIPKYSYQLWDLGEYDGLTNTVESKIHEIPIKFGLNNTNDANEGECTTPGTSGSSGNCVVGDYMTHPAFLAFGTNGLWVGKFEAGYKGATSITGAQVNANQPNMLQIKPNVYSWRNIQISNAYLTSYNYQRDLDSHMMKNTEWGSVAYLQHSAYGSATSVRINNNSAFITGYAAVNEPTTGYGNYKDYESTSLRIDGTKTINYLNPDSQVASTTGNYSGVYDMSGGSMEYIMSVMLDATNTTPLSGTSSTYNSGFNGGYGSGGTLTIGINFPEEKYYDKYLYSTSNATYNRRILGDATGEMGPFSGVINNGSTFYTSSWYNNASWLINYNGPWVFRNFDFPYGFANGLFSSGTAHGAISTYHSFRVVLAI